MKIWLANLEAGVKNARRQRGFTLLEVLISAVLIIVGVGAIGLTVISVRRSLKGAEDKAKAMRLASAKIEECLAKGYSGVDSGVNSCSSLSDNENDGFDWIIQQVRTETASGSRAEIPYKKIKADVSYRADKGRGDINSKKNISLTNILPYPIVHTEFITAAKRDDLNECASCFVPPDSNQTNVDPDEDQYQVVEGDRKLEISFNYAVKKDIKVAYTISVIVNEADDISVSGELDSLDTIYSTIFLDGEFISSDDSQQLARTPIMSQPTFNLIYEKEDVSKGQHTISVRWVKRTTNPESKDNTAGKIWLVSGELSMIATESP